VFDLSAITDENPAPLLVAITSVTSSYSSEIKLLNNHLLRVLSSHEIEFYSLADPNHPVLDNTFNYYSLSGTIGYINGCYFLLHGMLIDGVRTSASENPMIMSEMCSGFYALDQRDGLLDRDTGSSIQVVSIHNPREPHVIGSLSCGSGEATTVINDQMIRSEWRSDGRSRFRIVDISDPGNPVVIHSVDMPYDFYRLFLRFRATFTRMVYRIGRTMRGTQIGTKPGSRFIA
jgi:hypothetical protein